MDYSQETFVGCRKARPPELYFKEDFSVLVGSECHFGDCAQPTDESAGTVRRPVIILRGRIRQDQSVSNTISVLVAVIADFVTAIREGRLLRRICRHAGRYFLGGLGDPAAAAPPEQTLAGLVFYTGSVTCFAQTEKRQHRILPRTRFTQSPLLL